MSGLSLQKGVYAYGAPSNGISSSSFKSARTIWNAYTHIYMNPSLHGHLVQNADYLLIKVGALPDPHQQRLSS